MKKENQGLPSTEDVLKDIEETETETETEKETETETETETEVEETEETETETETESETEEEEVEETEEEKATRGKLPPKFLKEVKDLRAERRKLREENAELKKGAAEKVELPKTLETKLKKLAEAVSKEPWIDEFLYELAEGADEIAIERLEAVLEAKKKGTKPGDLVLKKKVEELERSNQEEKFHRQIAEQTKEIKRTFKNFDDDDIREIKRMAYVKSLEEGKPQESLLEFAKDYDKRLKALKTKLLKPVAKQRDVKDGMRVEAGGGKSGAERKELPRAGTAEFRKLVADGNLDEELGIKT